MWLSCRGRNPVVLSCKRRCAVPDSLCKKFLYWLWLIMFNTTTLHRYFKPFSTLIKLFDVFITCISDLWNVFRWVVIQGCLSTLQKLPVVCLLLALCLKRHVSEMANLIASLDGAFLWSHHTKGSLTLNVFMQVKVKSVRFHSWCLGVCCRLPLQGSCRWGRLFV